jgi:hypothetical protein
MKTSKQIHARDLDRLQDVTFGAVLRTGRRSFLKLLMAFDALRVERIRTCRHFRIFYVAFIVTIQASFRLGTVFGRS